MSGQECEEAFQTLKQLLKEAPILVYPDFEQEFLLETGASGVGLGALLQQQQINGSVRLPAEYFKLMSKTMVSLDWKCWQSCGQFVTSECTCMDIIALCTLVTKFSKLF